MPGQISRTLYFLLPLCLVLLSCIIAAWGFVVYRALSGKRILPPGPPIVVPWNGAAVLGVMVVFFLMRFIIPDIYFYVLLGRKLGDPIAVTPMDRIVLMSIINIIFLPVAWLILALLSRAKLADLGFKKGQMGLDALRGIIAWPVIAPVIYGLNLFILISLGLHKVRQPHALEQLANEQPSPLLWVMIFFSAVVVAPVAEEFLFRGILLGWFGKRLSGATIEARPKTDPATIWEDESTAPNDFVEPLTEFPGDAPQPTPIVQRPGHPVGWIVANVLISLIFAGLHADAWPAPIPLFFLALGLGLLYQRTRGIVAPITLHMTFNGISTVILLISTMSGGLEALKRGLENPADPQPPAVQKEADVAK